MQEKVLMLGIRLAAATAITPGNYDGYMSSTDYQDWYSFSATSGQGFLSPLSAQSEKEGDFDIHLYNPSGKLVTLCYVLWRRLT